MAIVLNNISDNYLEEIRVSVRISSKSLDNELKSLIQSARLDLSLVGISNKKINDETDNLIKNAIINYVRSEFGIDNKDSEKYRNSYEMLKTKMSFSQEYISEDVNNELG